MLDTDTVSSMYDKNNKYLSVWYTTVNSLRPSDAYMRQ